MNEVWKIQKNIGSCFVCKRVFSDGESHYSLLQIGIDSLSREDRCLECWKNNSAPVDAIFWRTKHFLSPQQKRAIDFDGLRELFLQLCEKREPAREALHYLVALLLVRKKILKIREWKRDSKQESLLLGFPRSQESFEIPVPDLPAEKLQALRDELKSLFVQPQFAAS